ncbi:hypothetical protein P9265_22685 [Schinkia azotoformans]|uniref:hypothetical protein n=1 Tax=Schinkia azotoformans TaxID=1454 RepID=UPI002DB86D94|nr:hypothetical protein [Schinkia azotoformans]MEC1720050.1 hypothetical protein [Schinkia azotoformans]MED4355066.1 hypothetical protein [Schinkia azotoformans]MED4414234.1 hypothetical protein [Schinkia azotoformans]
MPIKILLLMTLFMLQFISVTNAEVPLKATFVRDHQLWMKEGDQVIQLTKDKYVYSPQWSYSVSGFEWYLNGKRTVFC